MKIEALVAERLDEVAELERLCFAEPWSAESLALLTREGGIAFVAVEEGRAVAYGGMLTVLDEGQITNIATHPAYRRRGLGRGVTEALLAYAGENGIVSVSLEVRESNAAAIALYTALGFVECGKRANFYRRPTEAALVMVWQQDA